MPSRSSRPRHRMKSLIDSPDDTKSPDKSPDKSFSGQASASEPAVPAVSQSPGTRKKSAEILSPPEESLVQSNQGSSGKAKKNETASPAKKNSSESLPSSRKRREPPEPRSNRKEVPETSGSYTTRTGTSGNGDGISPCNGRLPPG